jgi:hypothetical protein
MLDDLALSACSGRGQILQNPMQASLNYWGAARSFGLPGIFEKK